MNICLPFTFSLKYFSTVWDRAGTKNKHLRNRAYERMCDTWLTFCSMCMISFLIWNSSYWSSLLLALLRCLNTLERAVHPWGKNFLTQWIVLTKEHWQDSLLKCNWTRYKTCRTFARCSLEESSSRRTMWLRSMAGYKLTAFNSNIRPLFTGNHGPCMLDMSRSSLEVSWIPQNDLRIFGRGRNACK